MNQGENTNVLIIGGGESGTNLLYTILGEPGVTVTGIVDKKDEFTDHEVAYGRNIPVFKEVTHALSTMPDIVFHLAESGVDLQEVLAHKPERAEIIEEQGIRLFINMIRHSRLTTLRQIRRGEKVSSEVPRPEDVPTRKDGPTPEKDALEGVSGSGARPVHDVLCIDGDEGFLASLRDILEPEGYRVSVAQKSWAVMEKAFDQKPDLIILDPATADKDGFRLFEALKSRAETADIPVIIITTKTLTVGERLKLSGKVESSLHKSFFVWEDLLEQILDLEIAEPVRTNLIDKVTRLFSKSYFQIRLAQEVSRADRHGTGFSILMAYIDGFRDYIQICGMDNYNACIRKIGDFLLETCRGSDVPARYGTGGFAVLLGSATDEGSQVVARRLLSFIEEYRFPGIEQLDRGMLTVSVAVVHYDRIGPCAPERMIFEAQNLIRVAVKSGGGNIKMYGLTHPQETDKHLDLVFSQMPSAPE